MLVLCICRRIEENLLENGQFLAALSKSRFRSAGLLGFCLGLCLARYLEVVAKIAVYWSCVSESLSFYYDRGIG